ncbi:hypothetical protein BN8_03670 [Fibrisoma limi BUZ 3]|uniref:Uncharacterized protein n=1 Tax=Fibrisoma limi BUZ 3 TaxID=1185876 RepID=I2GKR8_9BACT|nr:BACON domain-containing protein [Fibrisoma limi]CCH54494.1 hypothetical protein BN8_03670 [Fibrisoma limi BUZ 3]
MATGYWVLVSKLDRNGNVELDANGDPIQRKVRVPKGFSLNVGKVIYPDLQGFVDDEEGYDEAGTGCDVPTPTYFLRNLTYSQEDIRANARVTANVETNYPAQFRLSGHGYDSGLVQGTQAYQEDRQFYTFDKQLTRGLTYQLYVQRYDDTQSISLEVTVPELPSQPGPTSAIIKHGYLWDSDPGNLAFSSYLLVNDDSDYEGLLQPQSGQTAPSGVYQTYEKGTYTLNGQTFNRLLLYKPKFLGGIGVSPGNWNDVARKKSETSVNHTLLVTLNAGQNSSNIVEVGNAGQELKITGITTVDEGVSETQFTSNGTGAATWSVSSSPGVTINAQTGVLSVSTNSTLGDTRKVTITVVQGGKTATLEVTINDTSTVGNEITKIEARYEYDGTNIDPQTGAGASKTLLIRVTRTGSVEAEVSVATDRDLSQSPGWQNGQQPGGFWEDCSTSRRLGETYYGHQQTNGSSTTAYRAIVRRKGTSQTLASISFTADTIDKAWQTIYPIDTILTVEDDSFAA